MRLIDADALIGEFNPDDNMEYDAEGIRYYINSAPTVDNWISVDERLPEDDEKVLVCATIIIGDSKTHSTVRRGIETAKFISGKDGHYFCTLANWHVTHWMPLPSTEGIII